MAAGYGYEYQEKEIDMFTDICDCDPDASPSHTPPQIAHAFYDGKGPYVISSFSAEGSDTESNTGLISAPDLNNEGRHRPPHSRDNWRDDMAVPSTSYDSSTERGVATALNNEGRHRPPQARDNWRDDMAVPSTSYDSSTERGVAAAPNGKLGTPVPGAAQSLTGPPEEVGYAIVDKGKKRRKAGSSDGDAAAASSGASSSECSGRPPGGGERNQQPAGQADGVVMVVNGRAQSPNMFTETSSL